MIYGIGTDILRESRMQSAYARHGERLVQRILMPEEQAEFVRSRRPVRYLAMAFAAKEACVKALGTGFRGVGYRDCGHVHAASGQPLLVFSERMQVILQQRGIAGGHVSLSDEGGLMVAMVVLEKGGIESRG